MFNNYLGDKIVPLTADNIPKQSWTPRARRNMPPPPARQIPVLFFSATRSSHAGTIYFKAVNASGSPQKVDITLKGAQKVSPGGLLVSLSSANPADTNSITEPMKIVPVSSKISGIAPSFSQTLAPYSVNVFQIEAQ